MSSELLITDHQVEYTLRCALRMPLPLLFPQDADDIEQGERLRLEVGTER